MSFEIGLSYERSLMHEPNQPRPQLIKPGIKFWI